jgi:microcystin-dependent protein
MDYTQASAHVTHPGTGQRMAQDTLPVPTASTAQDFNMVIWSLMEVIKAAGLSAAQFNPDVPATYQKLLTALRKMGVPPGTVAPMARLTVPDGWLVANGQSILKASFPDLYSAIGDAFKLPGDSATEFRVPELRGEFIRGMDASRGVDVDRVLGSFQGQQVAAHKHVSPLGEAIAGPFGNSASAGKQGTEGSIDFDNHWWATNDGSAHDSYQPNPAGLIGPENRPRNVALLYMIKT